jgi:hypothetical protein
LAGFVQVANSSVRSCAGQAQALLFIPFFGRAA